MLDLWMEVSGLGPFCARPAFIPCFGILDHHLHCHNHCWVRMPARQPECIFYIESGGLIVMNLLCGGRQEGRNILGVFRGSFFPDTVVITDGLSNVVLADEICEGGNQVSGNIVLLTYLWIMPFFSFPWHGLTKVLSGLEMFLLLNPCMFPRLPSWELATGRATYGLTSPHRLKPGSKQTRTEQPAPADPAVSYPPIRPSKGQ